MNPKQLAMSLSRQQRKNQTPAEIVFWQYVRDQQFFGKKFRRQHPLFYEYYGKKKFFIADFYCPELHLIVEIDGGVQEQQKEYDQIRSEILEIQHELKIHRFKNEEVLININRVLDKIRLSF